MHFILFLLTIRQPDSFPPSFFGNLNREGEVFGSKSSVDVGWKFKQSPRAEIPRGFVECCSVHTAIRIEAALGGT